LFYYSGTVLHRVERKVIGAGVLLANNLMEQDTSSETLEAKTGQLVYVLWKVKKGVDTCGGYTELVCMKSNGMIAYPTTEHLETIEKAYEQIERDSIRKLFAGIHRCASLSGVNWHNRETLIEMNRTLGKSTPGKG
jgi:hypothetical protein